jgi:YVTN family beta-propeller protein
VSNAGSASVSVVSVASGTVSATIPVNPGPGAIAARPDGTRIYVVHPGEALISVISTASNTVAASIPVPGSPVDLAVAPDGASLYVARSQIQSVSRIDLATNAIVATAPVGGIPLALAAHPDGARVYVGVQTLQGQQLGGRLVVLTPALTSLRSVELGCCPGDVVIQPDGSRAYVGVSTQAGQGRVAVVDTVRDVLVGQPTAGTGVSGLAVATPGGPAIPGSSAVVSASAALFRRNERLTVGVSARNASQAAADLYAGAIMPDGAVALFFSASGAILGAGAVAAPVSFLPMQSVGAGGTVDVPALLSFTFPSSGVPGGTYTLFAALVRQGALLDDRIDPGDVLALGLLPVSFDPAAPPASGP